MTTSHIQTLLFETTKRATMRSYYTSKIRLENRYARSVFSDQPTITIIS
jgi:hypothetical protein